MSATRRFDKLDGAIFDSSLFEKGSFFGTSSLSFKGGQHSCPTKTASAAAAAAVESTVATVMVAKEDSFAHWRGFPSSMTNGGDQDARPECRQR